LDALSFIERGRGLRVNLPATHEAQTEFRSIGISKPSTKDARRTMPFWLIERVDYNIGISFCNARAGLTRTDSVHESHARYRSYARLLHELDKSNPSMELARKITRCGRVGNL